VIDATSFQIGNDSQMLVDNWLVEQADGVTRRWHKPQRVQDGPVLRADQPWERFPYFTYSNFCVLEDPTDGLVKCWYEDLGPMSAHQRHPWKTRLLYAVSQNGIDFEKPGTGIAIDGRPTNIVAGYVEGASASSRNPWGDCGVHSAGVVIDPHSTDQRYRMLFSRAHEAAHDAIECAFSADGVEWKSYPDRPRYGNSGSRLGDVSIFSYDPAARLFVHHTRHGGMTDVGVPTSWPGEVAAGAGGFFRSYYPHRPDLMNKRRIFRGVSHDLLNWSDLLPIVTPDDVRDNLDEALYAMPMFRVGALYFATPGILRYVDNEMDVRLMFSRDGIHWQDTDNARPFLAPRGEDHWDRHMVCITSAPVRRGDDWLFHHGGSWAHHDFWMSGGQKLDHEEARHPEDHVRFGMGALRMRYEGFASIDARLPRVGRLITRPVQVTGPALAINARCRPGGSVRVAIADAGGTVLPNRSFEDCVPFEGDAVRHPVGWREGRVMAPELESREFVKLQFLLDNAEIFSFSGEDV
jgi:hypothetical protein